MRAKVHTWAGRSLGLVPTMGALHAGHRSLITRARAENDVVVASIFVNPIQFGPAEDLSRYPRPVEEDLAMLRDLQVDAAYMPSVNEMYPPGSTTRVVVGGVAGPLEGMARPGHFEGVATVVTKLFWAVGPDRAYFGQKDAQQVAVVKRLAADLDTGVEIVVCPTVREADGLAVSSRNVYLSPEQRRQAPVLSRALKTASDAYRSGQRDPAALRTLMRRVMDEGAPLAEIDYAEVVDSGNFSSPGSLAVLAVRFGPTRLIDNHDLAEPYPG
jgi:pantoate--beta-alanine ligase